MGAVVFFLFFVAILLLCTPRQERGFALASMLAIGAAIWLAIRIKLHNLLGSFLGFLAERLWDHRMDLLMAFGIAILLIVPLIMIYVVWWDYCDRRELLVTSRKLRRLSRTGEDHESSNSRSSLPPV
jgi:hypothetical protein